MLWCGIAADNATNNDTIVAELESLHGANTVRTRIRCWAHVWNLIVKVSTNVSLLLRKSSRVIYMYPRPS